MLAELPLFIQDSIPQANVPAPQTLKGLTNGCRRGINNDLALSVRKVSQKSGDVESDHM